MDWLLAGAYAAFFASLVTGYLTWYVKRVKGDRRATLLFGSVTIALILIWMAGFSVSL